MKIINALLIRGLILLSILINSSVFAADQSVCNADANIVLFSNGKIQSCQLRDNFDANNLTCKSGGYISFFENGSLESCVLYAGVTISNTNCKPDSPIYFYSDGNLKACTKQD